VDRAATAALAAIVGPAGTLPTGFGANGNGADGGHGGGASATVSGDTLTAPSVQFTLNAYGGQGGAGGLGGNAGPAHGLNGTAGSDGAGSITFTNNVITVGSGIPGDTQLSGNDLLLLNLRVATFGPAGFFLPGTLDGGVGEISPSPATRSSATAQSRLVLQLGSTGNRHGRHGVEHHEHRRLAGDQHHQRVHHLRPWTPTTRSSPGAVVIG
jgi:hypothetical protein